jgi:hypothetical protein
MTEEPSLAVDPSVPARLRPVVARLVEIQRKCSALGPRNEEARDVSARLQAIIAELSLGDGDGPSADRYRDLARKLFPVARLFESLGFMSVAREVGHVERLLNQMDPQAPPAPAPTAVAAPAPSGEGRDAAPASPADDAVRPAPPRKPWAAIGGILVLVLAVVAAVAVVLSSQHGRERRRPPSTAGTVGGDAAAPAASTRLPTATPAGSRPPHTTGSRARLADLIGQSRLALQAGDLDAAASRLNEAAAVDVDAGVVRETAQELVTALIGRSDQAAAEADWERAAGLIERARDLALRFDLPTKPIDDAARRQGGLERYQRLGPKDLPALRAAIGSRVIVLADGAEREGQLVAVTNSALRLQLGLDVAGDGTLLHTGDIPLSTVREVRVYPD